MGKIVGIVDSVVGDVGHNDDDDDEIVVMVVDSFVDTRTDYLDQCKDGLLYYYHKVQ